MNDTPEWTALVKSREKLINFLVGQVLKANRNFNPQLVRASVIRKLDE